MLPIQKVAAMNQLDKKPVVETKKDEDAQSLKSKADEQNVDTLIYLLRKSAYLYLVIQ